ncbi:heat shock protein Hsp20 [Alcanivorax hongdengensis A-11-3]|uniref:Heat shock protein Hsp20 n=1 Tax=Alcanivorax hongdengensis A-11-3 TaxID=1177179 RepID=L0WFB5_9GAMM|nr:Hsp20/alpha crystallin family protein [Alcanivorax hongdengensis]EKF75538.1 heat shock protein Hsp20 [Alcanivorax hongdengensis A-11-3]
MDLHKITPWNWLRREGSRERPLPQRSPGHPLLRWDREFDNWFEQMLGDMAWTTPAPRAQPSIPFRPNLDILERPEHYLITAELPSMEKRDLSVTLDGDSLTIAGEKQDVMESEKDGYHYSERRFGQFQRLLTLPADADGEQMNATFHNGVLSLTIPRHEPHNQTRKAIEIH